MRNVRARAVRLRIMVAAMTPPLSPESRQQLQTLAEAATPGPWFTVGAPWLPSDCETYIVAGDEDPHCGEIVCDMPSPGDVQDDSGDMPAGFVTARNNANASYIAACDPQTVLALLSALAAQEAENERLRQELADADESLRLLRDLIADLRQSLAASTPEQK